MRLEKGVRIYLQPGTGYRYEEGRRNFVRRLGTRKIEQTSNTNAKRVSLLRLLFYTWLGRVDRGPRI